MRTKETDPHASQQYIELRGKGWERFEEAVNGSSGNVLLLVHPWYRNTNHDFDEREERYYTRYSSYSQRIFTTIQKAHAQRLPVILLLDAPSWWIRTQKQADQAVQRAREVFHSYGVDGNGEFFYVLTKDRSAHPLIHHIFQNKNSVFAHLRTKGVTYAVVGGGYFGGLSYNEEFLTQDGENPDPIAVQIREELRMTKRSTPHILEEIYICGCVSGAMKYLAEAGIRFRVGRGLTYPQQVPLRSEVKYRGNLLRWTKGFPL